MTLQELQDLSAWWQNRLELQDWRIHVRFVRGRHLMQHDYCAADIEWVNEHKYAFISIRTEDDYRDQFPDTSAAIPYDAERSLVHELLHIHTRAWETKQDSPESIAEEQAINALARTLVAMKRGHGEYRAPLPPSPPPPEN